MPELEERHASMEVALTATDLGDELIIQEVTVYAVPPEFRRYLQAKADLNGTKFGHELREFYEDAVSECDPQMALDHTSIYLRGDGGEFWAAGQLLENAFNKIGLFDFFNCLDSIEDIEAGLVRMRSIANPEETENLDAAIKAALELNGYAVRSHVVYGLKGVTERWPEEVDD